MQRRLLRRIHRTRCIDRVRRTTGFADSEALTPRQGFRATPIGERGDIVASDGRHASTPAYSPRRLYGWSPDHRPAGGARVPDRAPARGAGVRCGARLLGAGSRLALERASSPAVVRASLILREALSTKAFADA